jgi:hypothetical protein
MCGPEYLSRSTRGARNALTGYRLLRKRMYLRKKPYGSAKHNLTCP